MKIKGITFCRIGLSNTMGQVQIKAKIDYSAYQVFKNPDLLIENNAFEVLKGRNIYDILRYQDVHNFAVSERLKEALESNGVTGWSSYPITIEGIDEKYYGFWVTGQGGPVTKFDKDGNVPQFKPIKWDTAKWDGSDIFNIENTGIIGLTPKAVAVIQQFKVKSIEIKPL